MFGIGMPEMMIILVIALIVIGPQKLPDLAKSLGKGLAEFKNAAAGVKDSYEVVHVTAPDRPSSTISAGASQPMSVKNGSLEDLPLEELEPVNRQGNAGL